MRFSDLQSALFIFPLGIYIYFLIKRVLRLLKINTARKLSSACSAVISAVIVIPALDVWSLWRVLLLHFVAFSLLMEIVNRIVRKAGNERCVTRWQKIYWSGIIPVVCILLMLGYAYLNMVSVVRTNYTVYTDKNIREEGYRIAMITDLHFGNTMNADKLKEHCEEIETFQPDMVVLIGDIVDESTTLTEMKEVFPILGSIQSTYGTFYVYGNHDKSNYSSRKNFTAEQLGESLNGAGIQVLEDEDYRINEELSIIGRKDRSSRKEGKRKTPEELLRDISSDDFLLLLDHRPCELEENRQAGYDLLLSGHTHGGQFWPAGIRKDLFGVDTINYGYRKFDDFQAIVSSGIAGWGYPFRTGSHSEYVLIDIKKNIPH